MFTPNLIITLNIIVLSILNIQYSKYHLLVDITYTITYSIFKYLKSFCEGENQNLERANDQEHEIKLFKRF